MMNKPFWIRNSLCSAQHTLCRIAKFHESNRMKHRSMGRHIFEWIRELLISCDKDRLHDARSIPDFMACANTTPSLWSKGGTCSSPINPVNIISTRLSWNWSRNDFAEDSDHFSNLLSSCCTVSLMCSELPSFKSYGPNFPASTHWKCIDFGL